MKSPFKLEAWVMILIPIAVLAIGIVAAILFAYYHHE